MKEKDFVLDIPAAALEKLEKIRQSMMCTPEEVEELRREKKAFIEKYSKRNNKDNQNLNKSA